MGTLQSKLILSLVDKITRPVRGVNAAVGRLKTAQERNNRALKQTQSQMLGAVGVAYALGKAISSPVKAAMDFESSMADVKKVVDFPTPEAFQVMKSDIIALSERLPMTAEGIAQIVAAAGQAGMKGEELMQFAEMAAKVGVAFDMSADETGEALAKIKTALGLTVTETGELADAINHLSNTSASSAPDLIDFMKRVGSAGKQYGFTAEQTAAIGSAMIASGAEANVAATSFRNVGKALAKGSAATKNQRKAYKRLGLDSVKVSKSMQKDAVGTLNAVLEKVRELPKHLQATTMSQLFGDEARAIMPLLDNAELLKNSLSSVAQQANYLGSSQKEYEARAATTANKMQLFQNKVTALSIAIGEALLPAINDVMNTIGPYIQAIAKAARENPKLTATVVGLVAGLVALRIAAIAAKFSFLWMKGGLLSAAIVGLKGIGAAAGIAGVGLRGLAAVGLAPFKAIIGAAKRGRLALIGFSAAAQIGGIGPALAMATAGGAKALLGILNPLKLVTVAMRVLKIAVIGTGIGAILVGIAAAGTAIYNNWSGIKAMFSGFASGFSEALGPIPSFLNPVKSLITAISRAFSILTGDIGASNGQWAKWGETLGSVAGGGVRLLISGIQKLIGFLQSIVGFAKSAASAIGSIFSAGSGVKAPPAGIRPGPIAGARAAGGNVAGGKTYLVGERGPELVTPSRSGYVHNAGETAKMVEQGGNTSIEAGNGAVMGGMQAQQAPVQQLRDVHININSVSDRDELYAYVKGQLAQDIQGELSGAQGDTGWAVG